jgi:hypothetical protein
MLVLQSLQRSAYKFSGPFCSKAGKIPYPPGDLKGENLPIAHFVLEKVTISFDSFQLCLVTLGQSFPKLKLSLSNVLSFSSHPGKLLLSRTSSVSSTVLV